MNLLDPQPVPPSALSDADYVAAALAIGCEIAAIKAVTRVEAPRGAFDDQGRPTILYEPRLFSKLTDGRYDVDYGIVSNREVPSIYGKFSEQYPKLGIAYGLDPYMALSATSWGMFQILGLNCVKAGFLTAEAMVVAFRLNAGEHLKGFVNFIKSDPYLVHAMVNKEWPIFASRYNGNGYKQSQYDVKIAAAYNSIVRGS